MKRVLNTTAIVLILAAAAAGNAEAADYTVDYPDLVECYHWTRGCTPTAAAMVLSYWDHYAAGVGKYIHWGRLIDFYYSPEGTNNIPNLLDDLAAEFGTDAGGGTFYNRIRPGLQSTIEEVNYYDGTVGEVSDDFTDCWNRLRSEIDDNRPCLWSLAPVNANTGHSTAAWGYRTQWLGRWIILYDTWDWNPQLPYPVNYREDWAWNMFYTGNGASGGVAARWPQLNTVQLNFTDTQDDDLVLDQPYGGEVIPAGKPYTIWWYQWGDAIDNVQIFMSRDDGDSWEDVVRNLPSEGAGWHSYAWVPPCVTEGDVRIRVLGCNRIFIINFYVAGDGSFDQCQIVRSDPGTPSGTYVDDDLVAPGETYTLSWGAVAEAESYELSENGTWQDVGNATQWIGSKPAEGQYTYRVRAIGSCANSAANQAVTVTIQIPLTPPAGFAADVQLVAAGEPVTLSWQPVTGAVRYELETNGEWEDVGPNTSVVRVPPVDGEYVYRVKAIGRFVEGPASESVLVRVQSIFDVWPGDLDNDGTVTAADVLPLASYWNAMGRARDGVDMAWRGHAILAWTTMLATYADANGSGRIDMTDFLAICLNWGRTHTVDDKRGKSTGGRPEPDRAVLAAIYAQVRGSTSGPEYEIRVYLEQELGISLPTSFRLHANCPNPFNPSTRIDYEVPVTGLIRVRVFDVSGSLVRMLQDGVQTAGVHAVVWRGDDEQGRPVSAGTYFYRIDAPGYTETRKMTMVK